VNQRPKLIYDNVYFLFIKSLPEAGDIAPPDDQRATGSGIPIPLDIRVTFWPHSQVVVVAKATFQWLEACRMQFTSLILEKGTSFGGVIT
jgi:hypothetical protein